MTKIEDPRKNKRLGRGLSSLLNEPVPVQQTEQIPSTKQIPSDTTGITPVPISSIQPNRFQPRRNFDQVSIDRLADSIKRSGLMQPIILRPSASGYELVAGERRWRAAASAGLTSVPALVRDLSDEESAEWALVENVQREDLNPMERAWAFKGLVERFGLSHAHIAERVGLDRSTVTNTIRMLDLEERIRDMIAAGRLNAGHGKALLLAPPGPDRVKLAEQACDESWSVRRLERAAAGAALPIPRGDAPTSVHHDRTADMARVAARAALEKQLGEHLGSRVSITTDRTGSRGRLNIEFYSIEHFDGLLAKLGFAMR
jgi:ParB family transcriptional regulator, chromosome partitioning protein